MAIIHYAILKGDINICKDYMSFTLFQWYKKSYKVKRRWPYTIITFNILLVSKKLMVHKFIIYVLVMRQVCMVTHAD